MLHQTAIFPALPIPKGYFRRSLASLHKEFSVRGRRRTTMPLAARWLPARPSITMRKNDRERRRQIAYQRAAPVRRPISNSTSIWSRGCHRQKNNSEKFKLRLLRALDSHYDESYAPHGSTSIRAIQERIYRQMIHYSCDLCKSVLDPKQDLTYAVQMEVYPAPCEARSAIDNDRDHLEDINEVLERFEEFDADGELPENDTYQSRRFHLCRDCCQQFLKEPLGRREAPQFDFSNR
jgi:hypothetical protein